MVAENIIGTPTDVDYEVLKQTSVQRSNGRTILKFTVSQHWQAPVNETDGPFRIMWAIGEVSGDAGCSASTGYHANHRGVAPLNWLQTLGSTSCSFGADDNLASAAL